LLIKKQINMLKIINSEINPPKAIIFDTDNTLYPYSRSHNAAIKSVAIKASIILDIDEKLFKKTYIFSRNEIKKQLENTASSHSKLLQFQRTIENLGLGTKIFLSLDLEQTYWREFLSNSYLNPGIRELLIFLKKNQIQTANITDLTSQIQFRKIIYFNLDNLFDYVVTSEEAGVDKPNKLPFLIALKKLQIEAKDVWMVGDNFECDIIGAQGLHITSLLYNSKFKTERMYMEPDIIFDNYYDLLNLIKRILN